MASVLAVDDSVSMRRMVSFALESTGHQVTAFCDGEETLRAAKETVFDVVIADINLPGMNGIELIEALKRLPEYKSVPVLILSTEGEPSKKDEGKMAGAAGWIEKPFDPDELAATVNEVLKTRVGREV